jgi:hypothetical protein
MHVRSPGAIFALAMAITCLPPLGSQDKETRRDTAVDFVRFDAVVELSAPIMHTYATVFARYWVNSETYMVSIVWGEPHVGSLNISPYPVSVLVESTAERFRVASQIQEHIGCENAKPTGRRGPFYHKLNTYVLADTRFAEQEALATRIYESDLRLHSIPSDDSWEIIDVPASDPNSEQIEPRDVTKLRVRRSNDQVQSLRLYDPNNQMLKSIDYTYCQHEGHTLLARQDVILPEHSMCIGFEGEGLVAENGTDRYALKTMNTTHHAGERHCTIRHQPFSLHKKLLSVPQEITVATKYGGLPLRAAKLFDFRTVKMTLQEVRDEADRFGHFADEEMSVRQMLEKCWLQPASALSQDDKDQLNRLAKHFEERFRLGLSPGENLKRINMLFSLAMILGNESAAPHYFNEYISTLGCYDLGDMSLLGGAHMIDTAIRWHYFAAADKMLSQWVTHSEGANSIDSVKKFLSTISYDGHLWQIVTLVDRVLPSVHGIQDQCSLSVSKMLALGRLCRCTPTGGRTAREQAQISWALSHVDSEKLSEMFGKSIEEVQRLLAQYDENPLKREMNRWLDSCKKDRDAMANSQGRQQPP